MEKSSKENRASISKVFWLSMIVSVIAVGVLLILSMGAKEASADVHEFAVTSDSFICSNRPTSNYGSYSYLYCGNYYSSYTNCRPVWYLDIANNLPSDMKSLTSVKLNIYRYNYRSCRINFYELTQDFKERNPYGVTWRRARQGVNWNSQGGDYKSTPFATVNWGNYQGGYVEIDITTVAQGWIDDPSSNHGFIAIKQTGTSYYTRFYAREYSYYAPSVVIDYVSTVPKIIMQPNPTEGKDNYMYYYYYKSGSYVYTIDNYNYGRQRYMTVGGYSYNYPWYTYRYWNRGLLEFSSSYIINNMPPGIQVVKAELQLYREYSYRTNTIQAFSLKTDWNEGSRTYGAQTGASCWRSPKYNQAPNWNGAQPNTDYDPTAIATWTAGAGWNKIDITNTFIKWLQQPNNNLGILLKGTGEGSSSGGYVRFTSSDGSASRRPKIVIMYQMAGADTEPPFTELPIGGSNYEGYYKQNNDNYYAKPGSKFTFTAQDDPFGDGIVGDGYPDNGYTMYKIENTGGIVRDWTPVDATSDPMTFDLDTLTSEDKYTISYYSVDKAGNVEETKYKYITIDDSSPDAPTLINYGIPYHEGSIFINTNTTLFIAAAQDNYAGPGGTAAGWTSGYGYYKVGSGAWSAMVKGTTFRLSSEGDHTVWFAAVDKVGNWNPDNHLEVVLTVDATAPVTEDMTATPMVDNFVSYKSTFSIADPVATDYCGGGGTPSLVERTEYKVDSGPWITITNPPNFKITMMQGRHTIFYRSVDYVGNGNTLTGKTLDIVVDNQGPKPTRLYYDKKILFNLDYSHSAYMKEGNISQDLRDAFSDNGYPLSTSTDTELYEMDYGIWEARNADQLYVIEDTGTDFQIYKNDYLIGPKYFDGLNVYVNAKTKFNLEISPYDGPVGSGMSVGYSHTQYKFGDGIWNILKASDFTNGMYTIPKAVLEALGDGPFTFEFQHVDLIDNTQGSEVIRYVNEKHASIYFDNTPPVTALMTPFSGDWFPKDWSGEGELYVTSEPHAESKKTYFKMGESTDPGVKKSGWQKVEWCIDDKEPTSTSYWVEWENYTTVTQAIDDYELLVRQQYDGEFDDLDERSWNIYYRAWDNLDNIEETHILEIIIDDSSPKSWYLIYDENDNRLGGLNLQYYDVSTTTLNEYYANTDFSYQFDSLDHPISNPAGIDKFQYRIENDDTEEWGWFDGDDWREDPDKEWREYDVPIKLREEGTFIIYYRGIDNLNHQEDRKTLTIYVDKTGPNAPEIEVGSPSFVDPLTFKLKINTGTQNTLFKLANPLKLDQSSGIRKLEIKVDNGAWMLFAELTPTGSYSTFETAVMQSFYFTNIYADGEHIVYARATDKVGNVGQEQSQVIDTEEDLYDKLTFDSTPPDTEITKLTVTPGAGKAIITWEVSDEKFDHLNVYRKFKSKATGDTETALIKTLDEDGLKYSCEDIIFDINGDKEGTYTYVVKPVDEVENEGTGKTSDGKILYVDSDEIHKIGDKAPYVRIQKLSGDAQTFSAELLNSLPEGVSEPAGSKDQTYWDINSGQTGGTRAGGSLKVKLYFGYAHLELPTDMDEYMRVAQWDGHKWSDLTDREIASNEVIVTTTHFSIFAVVRAESDIGIEISFEYNPCLEGKQNIIYADITNYGKDQGKIFDVDEEEVTVNFTVKNPDGGWTDLGGKVVDVKAGETKSVSMTWDEAKPTGEKGVEVQIRLRPRDSKTEANAENNYAIENVAVVEKSEVTTSFVTNIVLLTMSTLIVVALSGVIRKRK